MKGLVRTFISARARYRVRRAHTVEAGGHGRERPAQEGGNAPVAATDVGRWGASDGAKKPPPSFPSPASLRRPATSLNVFLASEAMAQPISSPPRSHRLCLHRPTTRHQR
jgi:hypothetical protein